MEVLLVVATVLVSLATAVAGSAGILHLVLRLAFARLR